MKWIVVAMSVYALVAVAVFVMHVLFLQMVTPGLAFTRAAVWPYFWATGRPRGTPLMMD